MFLTIVAIIGIIAAAFLLVGLGMSLANRYNRMAWEKYYEGASVRIEGVRSPKIGGGKCTIPH